MLERLGIKNVAFNWRERDVPLFDEQIDAFKRHHINLLAWSVYDPDILSSHENWSDSPLLSPDALMEPVQERPKALITLRTLLETFKRHDVHPDLWLVQPVRWIHVKESQGLSSDKAWRREWVAEMRRDLPKTIAEQDSRVRVEAARLRSLVTLTASYGIKVDLYTHNGWFGIPDNDVAVIEQLKTSSVNSVGIVYNFNHSRDDLHDDTSEFFSLWNRIKTHVVTVNITAIHSEGESMGYPGEGGREVDMMRIIQRSGWGGPVGILAENGGDAELTLKKYLAALEGIAEGLRDAGNVGIPP